MVIRYVLMEYKNSSCSMRVRAALRYKKIKYESQQIDIILGQNYTNVFKARNPDQKVPALHVLGKDVWLTESIPIIEYLDDQHPEKPLLHRTDALVRFQQRRVAEIINSGIQPHQNLTVLRWWKNKGIVEEDRKKFVLEQQDRGMKSIESWVDFYPEQKYLIGDSVSIADICLFSQMRTMERSWKVNLQDKYPELFKVYKNLEKEDCFQF